MHGLRARLLAGSAPRCRSTRTDIRSRTAALTLSLPGLYFVGMLFLHSFSSMLVLGAGRDGERVAKHIAARASRAKVTRGREAQRVGEGVAA